MKTIPLTKGKVAFISDEDFEAINTYNWCAILSNNRYYAVSSIKNNGKRKLTYMHRLILGATEEHVDHIDGNTLNNTRENLRLVTRSQNMMNLTGHVIASSGYKGVYLDKKLKTWIVQIRHFGVVRKVSGIESEEIAALIYDLLAMDRFKQFAKYNFPDVISSIRNKFTV